MKFAVLDELFEGVLGPAETEQDFAILKRWASLFLQLAFELFGVDCEFAPILLSVVRRPICKGVEPTLMQFFRG